MRINCNDRYLSLALVALDENIAPELKSSSAKSALEMLKATLNELRKREFETPAILREIISDGNRLLGEINEYSGRKVAFPIANTDSMTLNELLDLHEKLTEMLTEASNELLENEGKRKGKLLRAVAEWELSYYERQQGVELAPLEEIDRNGKVPLAKESLEAFLNSLDNWSSEPVSLSAFNALPGGFGKQTYMCSFVDQSGLTRELVVRKSDPMPIMSHGACCLDNEYALLRALPESYPAPKPFAFAQNWMDVDADFYVMDRSPGDVPGSFLQGISGDVADKVFFELAEYLGQLHSMPLGDFCEYAEQFDMPGILEGNVSQAYEKNLQGWQSYIQSQEHLSSPFLVWLLDWLQNNIPQDERPPVLIHGDFNIHNVLVYEGGITCVLDWECANFGAAEQDLAYIRPHIAEHIEWDRFIDHYLAHGGRQPREELMKYGMVYSALRTYLAGNRGTANLQAGRNWDLRYVMVELGFTPSFMNLALHNS